jgi:hypothetical protein
MENVKENNLIAGTDDPAKVEAALLLTEAKGAVAGVFCVRNASGETGRLNVFFSCATYVHVPVDLEMCRAFDILMKIDVKDHLLIKTKD